MDDVNGNNYGFLGVLVLLWIVLSEKDLCWLVGIVDALDGCNSSLVGA